MYSESYQRRKKIISLTVLCWVIALLAFIVIPKAFALTYCEKYSDQTEEYENASDFKKTYLDFYADGYDTITKSLVDTVDGVFGTGSAALTDSETSASSMMSGIQSVLKMLGMGFVFFGAASALFSNLQRGEASIDLWIKAGLVAVTGIVIVENSDLLISSIEGLGKYIVDIAKKYVTDESNGFDSVLKWYEKLFAFGDSDIKETKFTFFGIDRNWWQPFKNNIYVYVTTGLKYAGVTVVVVLMQLPLLGTKIALYTIWIEILIGKIFFPIAVGDIISQGPRSSGIVFMKKFFALYLRIAMAYVIAFVCTILLVKVGNSLSISGDNVSIIAGIVDIGTICALYMAAAKMIGQTSSLAASVFGIH